MHFPIIITKACKAEQTGCTCNAAVTTQHFVVCHAIDKPLKELYTEG